MRVLANSLVPRCKGFSRVKKAYPGCKSKGRMDRSYVWYVHIKIFPSVKFCKIDALIYMATNNDCVPFALYSILSN